MSHWSKDAIYERAETLVCNWDDERLLLEAVDYGIENVGMYDRDDLIDELLVKVADRLMNQSPF